jgi:hypothetical protein
MSDQQCRCSVAFAASGSALFVEVGLAEMPVLSDGRLRYT